MGVLTRFALVAALASVIASGCAMAQTTVPIAGEEIYTRDCLACHMADGRGVPGMTPSLRGSAWVAGSPDALAGFVLTGGFGPEILMARFDYLSDAELAALLTFIRAEFAGIDTPVSVNQVEQVRSQIQ
jgi:mono/diheme cytochrome c family protein